MAEKPIGITFNMILFVLSGIMALVAGIVLIGLGGFLASIPTDQMTGMMTPELLGSLGTVIGAVMIIIGIISFVIAKGIWDGKNWARIIGTVLAIFGLLSIPIGTIISIIQLYFFWFHKKTKAYFK
ncbi:MAG: hypothetical protein ABH821_02465 [archaeon]